jgi:aminomethyltransferase
VESTQYSCLPNNDGGIVDDLIIYKMREQYLLVVNASNIDKDWDWISAQNDLGVEMKNLSDDYSISNSRTKSCCRRYRLLI